MADCHGLAQPVAPAHGILLEGVKGALVHGQHTVQGRLPQGKNRWSWVRVRVRAEGEGEGEGECECQCQCVVSGSVRV